LDKWKGETGTFKTRRFPTLGRRDRDKTGSGEWGGALRAICSRRNDEVAMQFEVDKGMAKKCKRNESNDYVSIEEFFLLVVDDSVA